MRVSNFMLERYRLGELDSEDLRAVNEAMADDEELRSRLKVLEESDRELRTLYPKLPLTETHQTENLILSASRHEDIRKKMMKRRFGGVTRYASIAAAVFLCIMFPVLYFARSGVENGPGSSMEALADASSMADAAYGDRAKGSTAIDCELSIYLKGENEVPLSDQDMLSEGNTVQLAYMAPAGEQYGVIFSIDGRSVVTMHFPYRKGQSSLLVSGRRSFLSEAYTLDDAPDYEIFVMVVSDKPLDVDAVLRKAQNIADTSVYENCEVQRIMILKK